MKNTVISILLILMVSCNPKEEKSEPNFVFDRTYVLEADQVTSLNNEIIDLENRIGSQIMILIIDSLHGESIDSYAYRIANEWGIGRKDFDDGLLILMALNERMVRIEVGYGLELIIKDEIAARIIGEEMAPAFREKKYYEGLLKAVTSIKSLIIENPELVGKRP